MSLIPSPRDLAEIFEADSTRNDQQAPLPAQPKKMNEANLRIMALFDQYDTEKSNELDVYQLRKYMEKEWKVSLSEESIKYHCGQTFLRKAYKVQRGEFIAFHKYIGTNIAEITVCGCGGST